jgi:hypothetical protein
LRALSGENEDGFCEGGVSVAGSVAVDMSGSYFSADGCIEASK